MTKPIVTEEMVEAAWQVTQNVPEAAIRKILEAALEVQPKPQLTEEERDWLDMKRNSNDYGTSVLAGLIDRLTSKSE